MKSAADDSSLFGFEFACLERFANDFHEMPLAFQGAERPFRRLIRGHAHAAAEGGEFATEVFVVRLKRILKQGVPSFVPGFVPGGRGELLIETARRDECIVITGQRQCRFFAYS